MPKMKKYESYAAWKRDQSAKHKRLIGVLERLVADAAPKLTKQVKWGQGCFADEGAPRIYIHTEPDHIQLGFYAGTDLDDPDQLLEGKGAHVRHVKVRTASDIDPKAFAKLIRAATR